MMKKTGRITFQRIGRSIVTLKTPTTLIDPVIGLEERKVQIPTQEVQIIQGPLGCPA
jgi:hypothetical protein